ncbi:MAG: hypothetical protein ACPIG6_11020, partial [Akkermansiaceae bacterium]
MVGSIPSLSAIQPISTPYRLAAIYHRSTYHPKGTDENHSAASASERKPWFERTRSACITPSISSEIRRDFCSLAWTEWNEVIPSLYTAQAAADAMR